MNQLPEHDPRPDLWARIEADLIHEDRLDRLLSQLPEHDPGDVWAQLEMRVQQGESGAAGETPVRRIGRSVATRWVAAASLAGLLAGWFWWQNLPKPDERITVAWSTETTVTTRQHPDQTAADAHFMTFVEQHCRQEVAACSRPEVKELKGRLDDLNDRKVKIEEKLSVFGNDPALVQAQIKIENERAEVAKQLVRELRI
ncbi:hypothetical protein [Arsenicibacter rosenii]|uniref:Uncharacterized protein n=1 Tax=Arsenicibacter rosenii TaxID=1750698 RepID=A0A1S2VD74_9BACT|nr:hypothetical protein [Arsenicibacter rosenii]OIN56664.1 hypothetical protein BLX24_23850 [Arsenicibacter rosenii]